MKILTPMKFSRHEIIVDDKSDLFDKTINAEQVSREVGMEWNLGNTLDAFDDSKFPNQGLQSETCWGNPYTTEEM